MVTIRTTNDIVQSLIDYFKASQPDATTNPGSVIRDLMIDAPASTTSLLYGELAKISNLQSLRLVSGNDLDRLAQNYGATRRAAQKSGGTALYTFASLPATVSINAGDLVQGSNGQSFTVVNGISVNPAQASSYKSVAVKYQNQLNYLNITDPYAVEVSMTATAVGVAGNISNYSLASSSTVGVSNVTNVFPFTGGSDQEDDATFRNRVLAIFSGSNIGTALGYANTALADNSVLDAAVIGPGNPLMTRDGTVSQTNPDGSLSVVSEGSGGKVDVIVLGDRDLLYTDTFIYRDQSNTNDPTNVANNFTLGQIPADTGLTITQRRLTDIANGILPAQPVDSILSVTGSLSGSNFIPETTDIYGRVSGNYRLVPDTGAYSRSPWGADGFAWTNNQIEFGEDRVKGQFNGQDATSFTDVLQIPTVQQNISITNENSTVSQSDQSIIQLSHTPATNVTRVLNRDTGELYTVTNQNVNATGAVNTSGQIQISGNTLPTVSSLLQVDYTWVITYDPYSDYDGKILANNPRPATDSIDWGMSNMIRNERILFTQNQTGTLMVGTSRHIISSVVSANRFSETDGYVGVTNLANFVGRHAIQLTAIDNPISTIESIHLRNTFEEIYFTAEDDGQVINQTVFIGTQVRYNVTVILPTDAPVTTGQLVTIVYNQTDAFNVAASAGSFVANQLTIPIGNFTAPSATIYLDTTYVAAVQDICSASITNFPLSRAGNGFTLNSSSGDPNAIKSNTLRRETQTIQLNGLSQLYCTLGVSSSVYRMTASQVVSVIDLRTNTEIWNRQNTGVVTTDANGFYQLVFSGYGTPAVGDNVLVLYFADDQLKTQPFTFANDVFSRSIQTLQFNFVTGRYQLPIQTLVTDSGISFHLTDTTDGYGDGYGTDGYLSGLTGGGLTGQFTSTQVSFGQIDNLIGQELVITESASQNNIGTFSILGLNQLTNTIQIGLVAANLNPNQVSVVRLADGADLWDPTVDAIDVTGNLLTLPSTIAAAAGDKAMVLCLTNQNLHQSPTRVAITTADQINNVGVLTLQGTSVTQAADVVFTATQNGLTQNLLSAMLTFLGTTSTTSVAANYLIRIVRLEKVSVTTGNVVLSTLATYDVEGTALGQNLFYVNEMLLDSTLSGTQLTLPQTTNNLAAAPVVGDSLRATFYYATDSDQESLYFTRNGTLYTNRHFATIDQAYVSSGFNASQSLRITLSYFTQPATGSRYTAGYNYTAPKQNERIVIQSNYNSLIGAVTFDIEKNRPITADVLVRSDLELLVDATVNIVVNSQSAAQPDTVIQNVKDKLTQTITSNVLGGQLSFSDVITAAQTVDGVARARVLVFNRTGVVGQALTLTAQQNQNFVANTVIVNQESL